MDIFFYSVRTQTSADIFSYIINKMYQYWTQNKQKMNLNYVTFLKCQKLYLSLLLTDSWLCENPLETRGFKGSQLNAFCP